MSVTQGRVEAYLIATSDVCDCELCLGAIKAGNLTAGECECEKHFCPCCNADHYCTENDR